MNANNRIKKISLIIPCYNEGASLPLFDQEISKIVAQMNSYEFEIIFIDDGSKDNPELFTE